MNMQLNNKLMFSGRQLNALRLGILRDIEIQDLKDPFIPAICMEVLIEFRRRPNNIITYDMIKDLSLAYLSVLKDCAIKDISVRQLILDGDQFVPFNDQQIQVVHDGLLNDVPLYQFARSTSINYHIMSQSLENILNERRSA